MKKDSVPVPAPDTPEPLPVRIYGPLTDESFDWTTTIPGLYAKDIGYPGTCTTCGWVFPSVDTFNAGLRIVGADGKLPYNKMYSCYNREY